MFGENGMSSNNSISTSNNKGMVRLVRGVVVEVMLVVRGHRRRRVGLSIEGSMIGRGMNLIGWNGIELNGMNGRDWNGIVWN
jgi:hypothetical protein